MLIGAKFEAGTETDEKILNPKTGDVIVDLPEASLAQVEAAVDAAEGAFVSWSQTTPGQRAGYLLAIADAIEKDAAAFAALESLNCGKPINAVLNDEIPAMTADFESGAVSTCQPSCLSAAATASLSMRSSSTRRMLSGAMHEHPAGDGPRRIRSYRRVPGEPLRIL